MDEEAQVIKEFEDQLIQVCQDNQDLAMCYSAYERPSSTSRILASSGRGKGGKKGGRFDPGRFAKKMDTPAERIASSNCRRCGARGHWKWECPMKESSVN